MLLECGWVLAHDSQRRHRTTGRWPNLLRASSKVRASTVLASRLTLFTDAEQLPGLASILAATSALPGSWHHKDRCCFDLHGACLTDGVVRKASAQTHGGRNPADESLVCVMCPPTLPCLFFGLRRLPQLAGHGVECSRDRAALPYVGAVLWLHSAFQQDLLLPTCGNSGLRSKPDLNSA